jgi:large subunit ribosomal protein L25
MAQATFKVNLRNTAGKGSARKLRASGFVPSVFYGTGVGSVSLSFAPDSFNAILSSQTGVNTILKLECDEPKNPIHGAFALVKAVQRDPISRRFLHADLVEVALNKKVTVSVPIHVTGKAKGVALGGILHESVRQVEVVCLPGNIPANFTIDIAALEIGDVVHLNDIKLPDGVEFESKENISILGVTMPVKEEVAAPVAEVVTEGIEAAAAGKEAAPGAKTDDKASGKDAKPGKEGKEGKEGKK